jgi:hypothetical protein
VRRLVRASFHQNTGTDLPSQPGRYSFHCSIQQGTKTQPIDPRVAMNIMPAVAGEITFIRTMKTHLFIAAAAFIVIGGSLANAQNAVRETVTTVQPTEVVGTVTELVPDAITVRTQETIDPVRYAFTNTTEYVDEAGNRVARDIVRTGVPVTIRYVREGDRLVANRVIVRKRTTTTVPAPEEIVTKKTTTTTTTIKD